MLQAPFLVMRRALSQRTSSEVGTGQVDGKPEMSTWANRPQTRPNFSKAKSFAALKFVPKMGHALEDYINLPEDHHNSSGILFNSLTLPLKWVMWTSKSLAGLPPHQSLRERLCNQSTSLGSVAGLYLVVAISAFFVPPHPNSDLDKILVDVFGVLMFFSAMALTVYICLALTVMYPLLESIPDFAATEAYRNLAERWGGYENFLFNLGCQAVLIAMVLAAKVIYGTKVLFIMLGVFAVLYSFAAFMTREFFIAIDPITAVHMGICNAPQTLQRAEALAEALRTRHSAFMRDPRNLAEYAAMHYMDSEVLDAIEQRNAGCRSATTDSEKALPRSSDLASSLVEEIHLSPQLTTAGARPKPTDRELPAEHGRGNSGNGGRSCNTEGSVAGAADEVEELDLPAEVCRDREHGSMTLEQLLLGRDAALVVQSGGKVSAAASEGVYEKLKQQGCVDLPHLRQLLNYAKWGSIAPKAAENGKNRASTLGESGDKGMVILMQMGIGAFPAMELLRCIQQDETGR